MSLAPQVFAKDSRMPRTPPKNGEIAMWSNRRVVKCEHLFYKDKMGSIIISSGTLFYSLLYCNSRLGYDGLKYSHSVISVIDNTVPGNIKK